jgi:hypothetical protein
MDKLSTKATVSVNAGDATISFNGSTHPPVCKPVSTAGG